MRMRIAPSSSYAAPSETSRRGLLLRPLHDVELERRRAVPLDPEPAQRALDLLDRLLDLAARVGVLDPQQALPALSAREEPVEEERAHAADVEEAGGRRSHADADGHRPHRRGRAWPALGSSTCSSALTCQLREASRRRSTVSRRSAATPSRSSRRARACGGPRRTHRRRSTGSAHDGGRRASRRSPVTRCTSSISRAQIGSSARTRSWHCGRRWRRRTRSARKPSCSTSARISASASTRRSRSSSPRCASSSS